VRCWKLSAFREVGVGINGGERLGVSVEKWVLSTHSL
jgi:hypothetical protein